MSQINSYGALHRMPVSGRDLLHFLRVLVRLLEAQSRESPFAERAEERGLKSRPWRYVPLSNGQLYLVKILLRQRDEAHRISLCFF